MHTIKKERRKKIPWALDDDHAIMREEDTCAVLALTLDTLHQRVEVVLGFGVVNAQGGFEFQPGRTGKLPLANEPGPDGTPHFTRLCAAAGGVEQVCAETVLEYIARHFPQIGLSPPPLLHTVAGPLADRLETPAARAPLTGDTP